MVSWIIPLLSAHGAALDLHGSPVGARPGLVTIVAVELITAKSGLGHLVYRHRQMLSTVEMYGAFALVGALGLLLTPGLGALQRRMLSWQVQSGTP
jgi:ABC-type nitrate/sulfonate/bicarbonate transport system permease component